MNGEEPETVQAESLENESLNLELTLVSAVRPAKSDLEVLLASNLAHATFSKPLDKIRLILETFMLLPPEMQEKIATPEERNRIERLYRVAVSLSTVVQYPTVRGELNVFGSVGWCFPPEQAVEHLDFVKNVYRIDTDMDLDELTKEGPGSPGWRQYLVELYHVLTRNTCSVLFIRMVTSEFIITAMPFALELSRRIFQQFISRGAWIESLTVLRGGKPRTSAEETFQ
jgi:hypothetical protein